MLAWRGDEKTLATAAPGMILRGLARVRKHNVIGGGTGRFKGSSMLDVVYVGRVRIVRRQLQAWLATAAFRRSNGGRPVFV